MLLFIMSCRTWLSVCLWRKEKKRENSKTRKGKLDPNIDALTPLSCGPFWTWSTPWELAVGTQACSSCVGPICRMHFLMLLKLTFTPASRSVCSPCLWRWVLSSVLQEKQVRVPSVFDLCYWREQLVPPDGLSVLLWHFLRSSSFIYLSFSSNTKSSLGSLICLLLPCCVLTWWDNTRALHFSNLLEMTDLILSYKHLWLIRSLFRHKFDLLAECQMIYQHFLHRQLLFVLFCTTLQSTCE